MPHALADVVPPPVPEIDLAGCIAVAAEVVAYVATQLEERGGNSSDYLPATMHHTVFQVLRATQDFEPLLLVAGTRTLDPETHRATVLHHAIVSWMAGRPSAGEISLLPSRRYLIHQPVVPADARPRWWRQVIHVHLHLQRYPTSDGPFPDPLFHRLHFRSLDGSRPQTSLSVLDFTANLVHSALQYLYQASFVPGVPAPGAHRAASAFRAVVLILRLRMLPLDPPPRGWTAEPTAARIGRVVGELWSAEDYTRITAPAHLDHALGDVELGAMIGAERQEMGHVTQHDVDDLRHEYRAAAQWIRSTFDRRDPHPDSDSDSNSDRGSPRRSSSRLRRRSSSSTHSRPASGYSTPLLARSGPASPHTLDALGKPERAPGSTSAYWPVARGWL
ncbi:hypothetical protein JCM10207_007764 [Rhodosporidiobolus poonsookiae]